MFFWVGDMPRQVRRSYGGLAAYAARVKGHVIALESKKVRNIPGSAQRSLPGAPLCFTQTIRVLLGKSWH